MYLGKNLELSSKNDLFSNPKHPYTQALLCSIPVPDPEITKKEDILMGDVPSPINPPSGCRFHPRCSQCMPKCIKNEPEMIEISKDHFVSCHLY
jgi:peptide/nickel transport system ATP-binding protein/oligopeptide transport system ATP-binding protein